MRYVVSRVTGDCEPTYDVIDTKTGKIVKTFFLRDNAEKLKIQLNNKQVG